MFELALERNKPAVGKHLQNEVYANVIGFCLTRSNHIKLESTEESAKIESCSSNSKSPSLEDKYEELIGALRTFCVVHVLHHQHRKPMNHVPSGSQVRLLHHHIRIQSLREIFDEVQVKVRDSTHQSLLQRLMLLVGFRRLSFSYVSS